MIHSHMDYDMQLSLESHVLQKACVGIHISKITTVINLRVPFSSYPMLFTW